MPTTNPVPSTDPSDLLFNAGKLDEVVNGAGSTYTDRLGVTRRTLGGIDAEAENRMDAIDAAATAQRDNIQDAADLVLSSAGYAPPVAYAAGIILTLQTQTVSYNGDTYAPKQSELPFTTSGTFETAKFRLIQGVASADLPALVGQDVQDYAALRAYTGLAKRIYITGLLATAKPAGIAGIFQHDPTDTTSADNGGTIIVGADGRRWKRDFKDEVSTKWFNPDRTGAVESTSALQSAINAAQYKTLVWSSGIYKHGQLNIPNYTKIIFEKNVELNLITAPANFTHFYIYNKTQVYMDGAGALLRMTKSDYSDESHHAINIDASTHVHLKDFNAIDCGGDGYYIGGASTSTACRYITLENCSADNCRRNGISVTFAKNVTILDGQYQRMLGTNPQAGIDLEPNAGTSVEDVTIRGAYASGNAGGGILVVFGAKNCIIDSCRSVGNGSVGFSVSSSPASPAERIPKNNTLVNCIAEGNGATGIYVYYANGTEIIAPRSVGNTGFGVQIQSAPKTKLLGGTVAENTGRGVALSSTSLSKVVGVDVTDNAGGGIVATGTNTDCDITGNYTSGNYDLSGTYNANIHVSMSAGSVTRNITRKGTGANQSGYGLFIASTSSGVTVFANDTTGGGTIADENSPTAANIATIKFRGWSRFSNGANNVGGAEFEYLPSQASSRSWRLKNDSSAYGDFAVLQETTQGGGTYATKLGISSAGHVAPGADNTQSLGTASLRWSVVYAGTGTINTSDAREKQDVSELDAAETRVAVAVKGLIRKFRFTDAVLEKGDAARIHFGVLAQDVMAAFEAEGLDPMLYGIVCYDEWTEQPEQRDDEGNVIQHFRAAGNRYGVRYEELLAFIIAAL